MFTTLICKVVGEPIGRLDTVAAEVAGLMSFMTAVDGRVFFSTKLVAVEIRLLVTPML